MTFEFKRLFDKTATSIKTEALKLLNTENRSFDYLIIRNLSTPEYYFGDCNNNLQIESLPL